MVANRITTRQGFVSENVSASYTLTVQGDINIISGALYVNGVTSSNTGSGTTTLPGGAVNQLQVNDGDSAFTGSNLLWFDNTIPRLYNSGSVLNAGRIYINEDLSGYITSSFGAMFFRDANVAGGATLENIVNGSSVFAGTFSTDGNLLPNIKVYLVNPGAAGVTLTVPAGQRTWVWSIIKSGSALGTISIAPSSTELINGVNSTLVLSSSLSASIGRTWTLTQVDGQFFANGGS